jgi:uncharacterized protein DUF2800
MQNLTSFERVHHAYSPSSLQFREACACFENRDSVNEAAIDGTLQHEVTETGEDNHKLDDDQMVAAAECMEFYERQKQLLVEERQREVSKFTSFNEEHGSGNFDGPFIPDVEELKESYLPVDDCVFTDVDGTLVQATTAGYVDRAILSWDRKRAVMIDWKFGAWAVEKASNNLQGIAYSLGLFKKYPSLESVTFYFFQPALSLLSQATFTRDQIPALYLRIQVVVAQAREAKAKMAQDDFSMARPMIPACNFCANIGRCPKVTQFACTVGSKFYPLAIPADITPTGLKDKASAALGIRLCQVMAVWAKAFRSQLTDRVLRGVQEIPEGFKVAEGGGNREIVDKDKFRAATLKYVTEAELAALADYTFGSVEELISDKAPRGSKKATLETYQADLLAQGAVKKGEKYSFLKAVSKKEDPDNA